MALSLRLPVFTSLRGYRASWLRGDVIAGLTVWAVLVPEALAYASIAGVSPVVGLYAAPGALILYAAFGSSKHLVVGPMAATAALSAAAVGTVAAGDNGRFAALTATLAITTGILALAAGLARLGFLANFISEPVLKGFIVGLALTIIIGQVPKLFLTGLFEDLPEATLGAVVIAALIELVDISALRALYRAYTKRLGQIYGPAARADFIAAVAAMLGVLIFDTLPGLFIGIAVSLLLLLYRVSRPHVAVLGQVPGTSQWADVAQHPEDETIPGVAILRAESGLFFANADHVRVTINEAATAEGVHAVVLDGETVPFVDVTAARVLDDLTADLHRRGVRLAIARDVGQVRDVLAQSGGAAAPEYFPSVRAAVDAVRADPAGQVAGPASTVKET